MKTNLILHGDVLERIKEIEDESVDCVITSPPYFGLRSYLPKDHPDKKKEIGSEQGIEEHLEVLMAVISEIKRVLKPTGSFWLNYGSAYGTGSGAGSREGTKQATNRGSNYYDDEGRSSQKGYEKSDTLMPERIALQMVDNQGWILRSKIVWAKQIYDHKLRKTKGSVMPTSVKDRFNTSWEYLYHFTKEKKYYFDLDAVRLPMQVPDDRAKNGFVRSGELYPASKYNNTDDEKIDGKPTKKKSLKARMEDTANKDTKSSRQANIKKLLSEVRLGIKPNTGMVPKYGSDYIAPVGPKMGKDDNRQEWSSQTPNWANQGGKNLPNVWLIGTEPSRELHFAKFPTALCEIPILASCPKDICKKCGKARVRITEPTEEYAKKLGKSWHGHEKDLEEGQGQKEVRLDGAEYKTVGWTDCGCNANFSPGIVLDPFCGSGTALQVAQKFNRRWIGIELNQEYIKIAEKKLAQQTIPL